MPIRVVLGEDDILLREGIARILQGAGLEVVAQTGRADDFLRRALAQRPDVAVVDVQMPPDNTDDGLRAARELREQVSADWSRCPVAVLRAVLRRRPDRGPRRGRGLPPERAHRRRVRLRRRGVPRR